MADLNALIAQGYQFQAPPDPFAQYGKMQQLQQGEQTNQLNMLKMDEYKRSALEQSELRKIMGQPGFDVENPAHQAQAYAVAPTVAPALIEKVLTTRKTGFDIKNLAADLFDKNIKNFNSTYPPLSAAQAGPQGVEAYTKAMYADPILGSYSAKLKPLDQAIKENLAAFNQDPDTWVSSHSNLTGTHLYDAIKAGGVNRADVAYGQSKNAPAPGAAPVGAPTYNATPLVPMPNEPMVAPAVTGLNADQARAQLAVAPNALAPQVAPVNALAAAPSVDRVKEIDARLAQGNTSDYKNSRGWADEKKILETERAELVKVQPDIGLMKALNLPNTQAGFATLQALKNSSPTEFERAIKAANLNPAETIAANRAYITHKTTHAPGTVVNIDQKQEGAFATGLGAGQAKAVLESKTGAQDAAEILRTNQVGRDLLKSGAITGTGADFFVGFNNALKQAGIDFGYADAAANSQAYAAAMGANVGRIVKQFGAGTGLSDADREYAAQIAGGKIALTDTALRRILDINDRAANRVIDLHNKNVSGIKTNIPLTVEKPAFTPPPPSGASLIPGSTPAAAGGGATVTLPDGRIKTFPNAAAANQFKKAAGL
jgi:hypothetical protein